MIEGSFLVDSHRKLSIRYCRRLDTKHSLLPALTLLHGFYVPSSPACGFILAPTSWPLGNLGWVLKALKAWTLTGRRITTATLCETWLSGLSTLALYTGSPARTVPTKGPQGRPTSIFEPHLVQYSLLTPSLLACLIPHLLPPPFNPPNELAKAQ